jgi:hypothetical protein
MTGLIVFLALLALAGAASALGLAVDSRDAEYSIGKLIGGGRGDTSRRHGYPRRTEAPVAQWIEQPPSKRSVAGSIPAGGTR